MKKDSAYSLMVILFAVVVMACFIGAAQKDADRRTQTFNLIIKSGEVEKIK